MFSSNKTVVGLFGNAHDMEKALAQLQAKGFGDDDGKLQIINKQNLKQQAPGTTAGPGIPPAQAHTAPGPAVGVSEALGSVNKEATQAERSTQNMLTDLGLDGAEAEFYARQVARGSSLVVIITDENRAAEAIGILEGFKAKTVTA